MKFKATKKEFSGYQVIKVLNGKLQTLLKYVSPVAYSAGVHGWSCDYYKLYNAKDTRVIYISTGYSPIGLEVDYKVIKSFEDRAQKLEDKLRYENYHTLKKAMNSLLYELIDYLINEYDKTFKN